MKRRVFTAAVAGLVGGTAVLRTAAPTHLWTVDQRPRRSRVAILSAEEYSDKLDSLVLDGLRLFGLNLRGKTVLLKPNLVEYIPGAAVNTNYWLVGAAAEAFLRLGAGRVIVGEGPGHQRDTQLVLAESGYTLHLKERRLEFVDLNRDEVVEVSTKSSYTSLGTLWLPRTVLQADLIVSMLKVKTHHWTGVTLSLKNMFGVIPGCIYGWPKNVLHWHGIERSILDVCSTVRPHFVIADGIIAMEGNGPLHGTPLPLHKIILADDPVAADFTCTRLLGLGRQVPFHLRHAARFLGNMDPVVTEPFAHALPHGGASFSPTSQR